MPSSPHWEFGLVHVQFIWNLVWYMSRSSEIWFGVGSVYPKFEICIQFIWYLWSWNLKFASVWLDGWMMIFHYHQLWVLCSAWLAYKQFGRFDLCGLSLFSFLLSLHRCSLLTSSRSQIWFIVFISCLSNSRCSLHQHHEFEGRC